jgi:hypothetical protein
MSVESNDVGIGIPLYSGFKAFLSREGSLPLPHPGKSILDPFTSDYGVYPRNRGPVAWENRGGERRPR